MEQFNIQKKLYLMGCAPVWDKDTMNIQNQTQPRQICQMESLRDPAAHRSHQSTSLYHTSYGASCDELFKENRRSIVLKEKKIELLKEKRMLIDQGIETTTFVNNALMSLSTNPLLYDPSITKLIGQNKKTMVLGQNRYNNLAKREEKAQLQLKKEKEKAQEKAKTQLFRSSIQKKNMKPMLKPTNKENKSKSNTQQPKLKNIRCSDMLDRVSKQLHLSKSIVNQ